MGLTIGFYESNLSIAVFDVRGRRVAFLKTKQDLMNIKLHALRLKVWFRALSRTERAIIDITIRCVDKVRSAVLASTISKIVNKILQCLEARFITRAERMGREKIEGICAIAEKWGNAACSAWRHDRAFMRFLGVNTLNT